MEYRKLPHEDEEISILGFGASSIHHADEKEIEECALSAIGKGINLFDMAAAEFKVFAPVGRAVSQCRSKLHYQIHFGATYEDGIYGWTTELDAIKRSVDAQLKALKTDYIDFGVIHAIDEASDLKKLEESGTVDYLLDLKKQGVVRRIGFSTNTPQLASIVLDLKIVDMISFSINPAYDFAVGASGASSADMRMNLYRRCEAEGVGIAAIKVFSEGRLLSGVTSPFKKALTKNQCLKYALDKPGVLTVLPGFRSREQFNELTAFLNAPAEELDYSVLGDIAPRDMVGSCVYCNHCYPCPMGIDIGLVNKYYDMARMGDGFAESRYKKLEITANSCINCGSCSSRCPFHVDQCERMQLIKRYFRA